MPPGCAPSRPPSDWTRSTRAGFAKIGCCWCSPRQHTQVQPARQRSFPDRPLSGPLASSSSGRGVEHPSEDL
jgi:hypothetical protein